MSLPQIRDEYRVPARPGARVTVQTPFTAPTDGTITGGLDDWIIVRRDGGGLVRAYVHEVTFHPVCTCFPVPPHYWTTHYGAVDPATMFEPNPECREHFPTTEEN